MTSKAGILAQMKGLMKEYFLPKAEPFIPGKSKIDLAVPSYGWEEAYEALESILTTQVTMGEKVRRFEQAWAEYIGVPYAVMVNSGSSANLLALSALANPKTRNRIEPGDEVVTPAVTWVTTVYPIVNIGAVPVLVDVDLDTLNISMGEVEKAITPKTKAIMTVHLCGNPCGIQSLSEIAKKYSLFLIEDSCESHGAEIAGKRVGSFGDFSTFSFYFTHHISTIEGGMVLTSNEEYYELLKSLRAFGWIRDQKDRNLIASEYEYIDSKFLFVNTGFNLRPTEIQGAFGIHQIQKLDEFIQARTKNAEYWTQNLEEFSKYLILPKEKPGTKHVWHHYPIIVRPDAPFTKNELEGFLNRKGLETRPVMTGNMEEQPVMKLFNFRKVGDLPNARLIHRQSFLFGVHPSIQEQERKAVVGYFREFLKEFPT